MAPARTPPPQPAGEPLLEGALADLRAHRGDHGVGLGRRGAAELGGQRLDEALAVQRFRPPGALTRPSGAGAGIVLLPSA